jgi:phosphoribosylaminoimidazole (AIR) synthetase
VVCVPQDSAAAVRAALEAEGETVYTIGRVESAEAQEPFVEVR